MAFVHHGRSIQIHDIRFVLEGVLVAIETPSQHAHAIFDWLSGRPQGFPHRAYLTVDRREPQSEPAVHDEYVELVDSLASSEAT